MKKNLSILIVAAVFSLCIFAQPKYAAAVLDPVASPEAGSYKNGIQVNLSSDEPATHAIRYTKNGGDPGCRVTQDGTVFSSPIKLIANATIKAITCTSPSTFSNVATFVYTFTGGSGGGGPSSNPTEVPGGPTCATDATYCAPGTPISGEASTALNAPAFANILANTDTTTFARDLTLGSDGVDVAILQQLLIRRGGVAAAALAKAGATGYFGTITQNALIEFQKSTGITPAAGYFGAKSRARINALAGILPSNVSGSTTAVTPQTLLAPQTGSATEILNAPTSVTVGGSNPQELPFACWPIGSVAHSSGAVCCARTNGQGQIVETAWIFQTTGCTVLSSAI